MSLIFLVSVCLHLFPPSLFFFLSASSSCCSLPSASILTKWRKPLTTSWPWRRSTLTPIHSETLHFISHLCYFITYAWVLWLIKLSLVSALWIPGLAVKAWLWKWINNTHFLLVTHFWSALEQDSDPPPRTKDCAWTWQVTVYKQPFLLPCVPRLGISLQASLLQIVGYRSLVAEVEKLRREPYDCENPKHEDMLMKVHSSLWLREQK